MITYRGWDLVEDIQQGLCIRRTGSDQLTEVHRKKFSYYVDLDLSRGGYDDVVKGERERIIRNTPRELLKDFANRWWEYNKPHIGKLKILPIHGQTSSGNTVNSRVRWHQDEDNL